MTKEQLKSKINELINNNQELINDKIERAIASGCLDIECSEDNYRLAKNILSAVYRDISNQYKPLSRDSKDLKAIEAIYACI